jgi:hypothetical protein
MWNNSKHGASDQIINGYLMSASLGNGTFYGKYLARDLSGCWRRRKISEMYKLYDERDVVKFYKLIWAGQVIRMEESGPVRKVLCTKPGGIGDKKRGRPEVRWCDELEEDVARVGCRNWRLNAQSREEWRKLTEELRSHPGMGSHGKKKNGLIFKGQTVFLDCLILENRIDRLSRNVGKQLPTFAA